MDPNRAEALPEENAPPDPLAAEAAAPGEILPALLEASIPLEQHQRLLAEFDNYRKRVERERQRLTQTACADLLRSLLPVLDDLDRAEAALQAPDQGEIDLDAMLKIVRLLAEALRREGLVRIDAPPGTVFDPNEHEAVLTIPTAEMPEGSVIEALQAGYRLGDRLLRPARVAVARAIDPPPEGPGPDAG